MVELKFVQPDLSPRNGTQVWTMLCTRLDLENRPRGQRRARCWRCICTVGVVLALLALTCRIPTGETGRLVFHGVVALVWDGCVASNPCRHREHGSTPPGRTLATLTAFVAYMQVLVVGHRHAIGSVRGLSRRRGNRCSEHRPRVLCYSIDEESSWSLVHSAVNR